MSDTGYKFSSAQAGDHDELHELVQGKGTYTGDISAPGQLHACFRSEEHTSELQSH